MRKILPLLVVLTVAVPSSGETFIGRMLVSDGGSVNNATTGYGSAGCNRQQDLGGAGACDQAFAIGVGTKLTLEAVDELYVTIDRTTTDAGLGMHMAANEKLPTALSLDTIYVGPLYWSDAGIRSIGGVPDGGSYTGGVISITPAPGSTSARLKVSIRNGRE